MTSTLLTDALVGPQDPGTGIDGFSDPPSAGIVSLIGGHEQGSYVRDAESGSLAFENVDTSANTFDLAAGVCYILDDASPTAGSRDGPVGLQTSTGTDYSASIPGTVEVPYVVVLQTSVSLDLNAGTNDVHISVDPTTRNSATVHVDEAEPSDPSLFLGTVDSDTGDVTRANDGPNYDSITLVNTA